MRNLAIDADLCGAEDREAARRARDASAADLEAARRELDHLKDAAADRATTIRRQAQHPVGPTNPPITPREQLLCQLSILCYNFQINNL